MGRYATLIFLAALVMGCKSDPAPSGCIEGASVECACADGAKGAQVCTAAGTLSPCSCTPSTASVSPTAAPAPAAEQVEPTPTKTVEPATAGDAAGEAAAQAACETVLAKVAECRGDRAFRSQVNQTQLKALSLVLADVKSKAGSECFNWLQQAMVEGGPRFSSPDVRAKLLQSAKADCETFGRDFSAAGGFPVDIAGND